VKTLGCGDQVAVTASPPFLVGTSAEPVQAYVTVWVESGSPGGMRASFGRTLDQAEALIIALQQAVAQAKTLAVGDEVGQRWP
jgi:hypothetical protein